MDRKWRHVQSAATTADEARGDPTKRTRVRHRVVLHATVADRVPFKIVAALVHRWHRAVSTQ